MNFKKIITAKKFWTSVLLLALAFIVFYNLIRIFFEYKFDFNAFFSYYFQEARLPSFIVANIIGGLFYGFVVVFFRYYRRFKEEERQENKNN